METKKENSTAHVGEKPENEMTNETTQQPEDMTIRLDVPETEESLREKYFDTLKENEQLKAQNVDLIEKLKSTETSLAWNRNSYLEYMTQRDILKKALEELCKRKNISVAEMYEAMMTANEMTLDVVLIKLGKSL